MPFHRNNDGGSSQRGMTMTIFLDDRAHIPTQNFLGTCLMKTSAKAENSITVAPTE